MKKLWLLCLLRSTQIRSPCDQWYTLLNHDWDPMQNLELELCVHLGVISQVKSYLNRRCEVNHYYYQQKKICYLEIYSQLSHLSLEDRGCCAQFFQGLCLYFSDQWCLWHGLYLLLTVEPHLNRTLNKLLMMSEYSEVYVSIFTIWLTKV